MKTVIDGAGNFCGSFPEIEEGEDALDCGSVILPFTALGEGWQILEGVPPAPGCTWIDGAWVSPDVQVDRADLVRQIDDVVAAIYARVMRFAIEYTAREAQAQSFKDAGYKGIVPPRVAEFATPAVLPPKQAADLILNQAAQQRGALELLGALRMRKHLVLNAATDGAALAASGEILAQIHTISAELI